MSYSVFLLRFVDGEVAALDAGRLHDVIGPHVVVGGPDEGFSQLRAEDGGAADLYHARQEDGRLLCVTATHFASGAMTDLLARLAVALGAAIVPQDGGAFLFREEERPRLPSELREQAVVLASERGALEAAIRAL